MNLSTLWNSQGALTILFDTKGLDVDTSWDISKLVRILDNLTEQHGNLVKTHFQINNDGSLAMDQESPEFAEYISEFTKLTNKPLPFMPVKLEKLRGSGLSPRVLAALHWLIADE